MEGILGCTRNPEDDYYRLLGCDESASNDQILAEFRVRALDVHPDRHPENHQSDELFKKLLNAKQVLTDAEKRKSYDCWRSSGISMPFEQWQSIGKNAQMCFHWAVRKQNDLMLEPGSAAEGAPTEISNIDGIESIADRKQGIQGDSNCRVHNFRCNEDPPSESLRKFRAYEI